jgi:Na+-driven multidrug efflux pump
MYVVLTILKAVIILVGLGLTVINLIQAIGAKDRKKLKKAGLLFLLTFLSVIIVTGIEFIMIYNK